jgi:hypothetical protein
LTLGSNLSAYKQTISIWFTYFMHTICPLSNTMKIKTTVLKKSTKCVSR